MSYDVKRLDSGDRLVTGIDNLNRARVELKEAASIIAGLAGREIRSCVECDRGMEDSYFSCSGTKGWLLTTNKVNHWKIIYTDYNGGSHILYTSDGGCRDLPIHVVLEARADLHVLVDGLADQFLEFRGAIHQFFLATHA